MRHLHLAPLSTLERLQAVHHDFVTLIKEEENLIRNAQKYHPPPATCNLQPVTYNLSPTT